jgi:hypothetical protein
MFLHAPFEARLSSSRPRSGDRIYGSTARGETLLSLTSFSIPAVLGGQGITKPPETTSSYLENFSHGEDLCW